MRRQDAGGRKPEAGDAGRDAGGRRRYADGMGSGGLAPAGILICDVHRRNVTDDDPTGLSVGGRVAVSR
jgi:hypothetical protein